MNINTFVHVYLAHILQKPMFYLGGLFSRYKCFFIQLVSNFCWIFFLYKLKTCRKVLQLQSWLTLQSSQKDREKKRKNWIAIIKIWMHEVLNAKLEMVLCVCVGKSKWCCIKVLCLCHLNGKREKHKLVLPSKINILSSPVKPQWVFEMLTWDLFSSSITCFHFSITRAVNKTTCVLK